MTQHRLTPHRSTLHGTFSPQWSPVLSIAPGDSVEFETLDARWSIESHPQPDGSPARQFAPRNEERDNGHALCGPVFVEGAQPGMVLSIEIGPIVPGASGWTSGGGWVNGINERVGAGADELRLDWTLDAGAGVGTNQFGQLVRLAPFFGVMGMPGPDTQPVPSWTPRPQGGNIDCKELVSGTTLFLPIAHEGGLFSVGDGHARQGDGEVSGTAIECPISSGLLTFNLRDDLALTTPIARIEGAWLTFGFHEDLDEAVILALDAMLDVLGREHGLNRNQALALSSVAVDLRVTQIVNGTRGIHAVLRDDAVQWA